MDDEDQDDTDEDTVRALGDEGFDEPEVEEEEEEEEEEQQGGGYQAGEGGQGHQGQGAEDEEFALPERSAIKKVQIRLEFISALRTAKLDDSGLEPWVIERLRNPIQAPLQLDDRGIIYSMRLFFLLERSSKATYTNVAELEREFHPEMNILSLDQVKRQIQKSSGVVPLIHHMCPNSCIAYTGPRYSKLMSCPKCKESRYDPVILAESNGKKLVPLQEFYTIPLGPIMQALFRTVEGCKNMAYFMEFMKDVLKSVDPLTNEIVIESYDDCGTGSEFIEAVLRGHIKQNDIVVMFSLDGAQLYKGKKSDCSIYIWVIFNLSPDLRYKKKYVIPGGFIPGPKKPEDTDSFLFPGLHHVAALHNEGGLKIWKASTNEVVTSDPFLAQLTADRVGLPAINGMAGHTATYGCRTNCDTKGRHKPEAPQYYPAHLQPSNYTVPECNHGDVDVANVSHVQPDEYHKNLVFVMKSPNITEYAHRRAMTGISGPSIFHGISARHRFSIPGSFPIDLMHLVSLNVPDLLVKLWRGTIVCDPSDNKRLWTWAVLKNLVWERHGKLVEDATPYLPGSFDKAPRNPAAKMSSNYKAWEFLIYIFGLCPGILHTILPDAYWKNFCKLVAAMRILHQKSIKPDLLKKARDLIVDFVKEFELLYYSRKVERIHFCRQSIHALLHLCDEVIKLGPGAGHTQYTMERTIGNLGEEIKQPSNPYKNLSERGLQRAQATAMKAMYPEFDKDKDTKGPPRGSLMLGDGFILLRAMDRTARVPTSAERIALQKFMEKFDEDVDDNTILKVTKWSRLRLPNGQNARSAWKENLKPLKKVRMSRNVKVCGTIIMSK